jgi:hypothetical protein
MPTGSAQLHGDPGLAPRPSEQECRALVQRVLASDEFRRTSRLRDFLLYVVDRKFAGSPQDVTEVLIGHRVFRRPAEYNPGEDSIVRTEARNLRQRLARYFAGEGSSEPIVLEIPRGGYLPVFRWRASSSKEVPASVARASLRKPRVWLASSAALALAVAAVWSLDVSSRPPEAPERVVPALPLGAIALDSSDPQLIQSFQGAAQRAMGYTYTGDPVGDWYDSTAGNRYAFCMRDVSHQSIGAAALGLTGHTRNMLRRFADSVARSRDWCGFWEINKDGFPAPVNYRNDDDFWYCLPANFDLMRAAYRQFLWTNDPAYFDPVFSNFYDRTVIDYVEAWDRDRDGMMEGRLKPRRRGIPSYYQEDPDVLVGADLLAAQYHGYLTYAAIQQRKGVPGSLSQKLAERYREKAQALRIRYNTEWWNPVKNRYYSAIMADRTFNADYIADANTFALLFEITEDGLKTEAALDCLETIRPEFDQTLSYAPEVLFHYGRRESAYRFLLEITGPGFQSRGMPEINFAAVGAVVSGLMGLSPEAPESMLETLPRLPEELEWVKLSRVPVLQNEVEVVHHGVNQTTLTNQNGPLLYWKASFPASADKRAQILIDDVVMPANLEWRVNRQKVVSVVVPVRAGQTRTARNLPPGS